MPIFTLKSKPTGIVMEKEWVFCELGAENTEKNSQQGQTRVAVPPYTIVRQQRTGNKQVTLLSETGYRPNFTFVIRSIGLTVDRIRESAIESGSVFQRATCRVCRPNSMFQLN
jgi:hypothetical protein